jgi:hypothetical protein
MKIMDNGQEIEVEKLKSGVFSSSYRNGDTVYVQTTDALKDMFVMLSGVPHLPEIEYIGNNTYKMPFYTIIDNLPAKSPHVSEHKTIRKSEESYRYPQQWDSFLDRLKKHVSESVYDAAVAFTTAARYLFGDLRMNLDMHDLNIAVDKDGNIVFLDPIALWEQPDFVGGNHTKLATTTSSTTYSDSDDTES